MRNDEHTPEMEAVVAYFERSAIPYGDFAAPPLQSRDSGGLKFSKVEIRIAGAEGLPATAGLTWIAPQSGRPGMLLACDMRTGGLYSISPGGGSEALVAGGSRALSNPCHVEPCDLDGDGVMDLVVADLGNFYPTDLRFGRVVWLRGRPENDGYEPIEVASELGRVADVQPVDFDGDGDQDLLVAEFGLHDTGSILLAKNLGVDQDKLKLEMHVVDRRHGAVHLPVADLNADGRLDFVALISQEYEVIEAFLNRGDGTFVRESIYTAPTPSWGSSGIQLLDLDADGDLDALYSNGDSYDRSYLKPYHAIRWLENQGRFPWAEHPLTAMPGCTRALAGDLDGNGDLDVVGVALVPSPVSDRFGEERFEAVCWLEQTARGEFLHRMLETSSCDHLALALGDFDGDGDLDLAVGDFYLRAPEHRAAPPSLTIWWNETRRSLAAPPGP